MIPSFDPPFRTGFYCTRDTGSGPIWTGVRPRASASVVPTDRTPVRPAAALADG